MTPEADLAKQKLMNHFRFVYCAGMDGKKKLLKGDGEPVSDKTFKTCSEAYITIARDLDL